MVFRNLRERFCIDDQDYQVRPPKHGRVNRCARRLPGDFNALCRARSQNSLTRSAPLNSDTQGRFGSRILSSYDHRFVIKTVSSEDIAEMHNILKKYHQVEAPPREAAGVLS